VLDTTIKAAIWNQNLGLKSGLLNWVDVATMMPKVIAARP
jgi:hypothetical protein